MATCCTKKNQSAKRQRTSESPDIWDTVIDLKPPFVARTTWRSLYSLWFCTLGAFVLPDHWVILAAPTKVRCFFFFLKSWRFGAYGIPAGIYSCFQHQPNWFSQIPVSERTSCTDVVYRLCVGKQYIS